MAQDLDISHGVSSGLHSDAGCLGPSAGHSSFLWDEYILKTMGGSTGSEVLSQATPLVSSIFKDCFGPIGSKKEAQINTLEAFVTNEHSGTSSSGEGHSLEDAVPRLTWKSVVQRNSSPPKQQFRENLKEYDSKVDYNDDGTTTLSLPRSFLENARKKWDTSCIGHFIGGSFPFKFVKDKATILWGNLGLQNVFFSSKGYFTFKFGTIEEMEAVLSLNSVNIGGKRLYLGPWTDGSQFKRNAIKSISTWVKLVDVPHSYWSVEGLGTIAKVIGKPLSLDKQTALLNPMKFAGVLIQLQYGTKVSKRDLGTSYQ